MAEPSGERPRRRRSRVGLALAGLVVVVIGVLYVVLILAGVFGNGGKPLTTLTPHGVQSEQIQTLITPVYAVAGVVMVGLFAVVFYIVWRFRDRGDDEEEFPTQLEGNTSLELGWTIIPLLVLVVVGVFTVATIVKLNQKNDNAIKVEVSGQQWWWAFHYDVNNDGNYTDTAHGDIITANELVIPIHRQVALTITSRDVIHSFWIPALNGKKDAVPGQHHPLYIEANTVGVYRGQCTQFCGLSHANMRMLVRAVTPSQYAAWVANQQKPAVRPTTAEAAAGEAVFKGQLCSSCHLIRGVNDAKIASGSAKKELVSGVAPDLTHLATRGTFAGSIFNLYDPSDPSNPSKPGNPSDLALPGNPGNALFGGDSAPFAFNSTALQAWIRNPPLLLPEAAAKHPGTGAPARGMPDLNLSELQLNELVAYFETLK
jgi:cytochrome c oxidase subunit II